MEGGCEMIEALLVTPLPPLPTGLSDYAKRILALTDRHVKWKVAYPSGAQPLNGYECIPVSALKSVDFKRAAIYQVGNSPHCEEVIETLLLHGGTGLFHETNLHHVLRNRADSTGDWRSYQEHVEHEYGDKSPGFLKIMGKKARSLPEYDRRLRKNSLVGKLAAVCSIIAVLSDTARWNIEKLAPGKPVVRMGFLPDFMERVVKPAHSDKTTVIGVAGTFHYGRSFEEMVNAVAMLKRIIDCRLLVAGAGWPSTDYPWVEITGRLSDREFREQIELFDMALDLRHHTCGETSASMMDILRSGIPAVVTSEGTFRDIPADAVLRVPSESGSAGAFAALKYLIENQEVRASISLAAEQYFASISNKEQCLCQWLELIERSAV
jgi:glycosyltransferase involved in cell wall biosynthesis